MNENASLSYRVNTLVEENKELASESVFIKRKAGELAKCVLKMREDHRVYLLHRKIEDLQAQIHGLEKRNKEYYEKLLRRDVQEDDGKKGVAFSAVQRHRVIIPNKHGEKLVGTLHESGTRDIVILCHGFRCTKVNTFLLSFIC